MSDTGIEVPYNHELKPLEDLLAGVKRPGDFFVQGALEAPIPRVEVEGAGVISFPVPASQIQQLVEQATRAPYGRGEDTIVNESVRKVWQLPTEKVRIGGKSWERTFQQILAAVTGGLGCEGADVSAELYKLLVYDKGGFFKPHRDTEKTGGMFGTLVLVLPSEHRGGELVLRHAGREVVADLSTEEFSELKFAAFYADCEHEVLPIMEGNRVCLIYNLIQQPGGKPAEPLTAPLYQDEIATASRILTDAFRGSGGPAKLAWLLEHQYSPDGLSFAGLKGGDAAQAEVLRQAAVRAGCALHLGIVHIEEYGPAEPDYGSYPSRSSRWRQYDEDGVEEEDADSTDFEVVEVSDGSRHIDQWRDAEDHPVEFGKLPLEEGEVLPAGALDEEAPDEQRLTEATGNEGASFERSYHRAALVIWPRDRFAGVLLQASVSAALPHLSERIEAGDMAAASIAEQIIEVWENPPTAWSYRGLDQEPSRAEMLRLLAKLCEQGLLERFITGVVVSEYDGSENDSLAASLQLLGSRKAGKLLTSVALENMPVFHRACVNLLGRVLRALGGNLNEEWKMGLREMASAMVGALRKIEPTTDCYASANWQRVERAKPVDAAMVAGLLDCLRALGATELRTDAAVGIVRNLAVFDPVTVIVPALAILAAHERKGFSADADCARLWSHAAEFLLARSEQPPKPPSDWRQAVSIDCKCEDCNGLEAFARDSVEQVHRFRVRKDRRQHLHQQIQHHELDMTHVTERKGSPQTLVCTKTQRTYERQCAQHKKDCAAMITLLSVVAGMTGAGATLASRMVVAKDREA